jgi:hypothetical protein
MITLSLVAKEASTPSFALSDHKADGSYKLKTHRIFIFQAMSQG